MTNIDDFKGYISSLIVSDDMLKKPITMNNNRYWPVSIGNKKRLIKELETKYFPIVVDESVNEISVVFTVVFET